MQELFYAVLVDNEQKQRMEGLKEVDLIEIYETSGEVSRMMSEVSLLPV